jgi:hypothetical protein
MQGLGLALQGFVQELHNSLDFFGGTAPVLGGESVDGNVFDASLAQAF